MDSHHIRNTLSYIQGCGISKYNGGTWWWEGMPRACQG